MAEQQQATGTMERPATRRAVLRGGLTAAAGLAAAALAGCATSKGTQPTGGSEAAKAAGPKLLNGDMLALNDPSNPYPWIVPEPDTPPKRGGIFRHPWAFDIASLDPTAALSITSNGVPAAVAERLLDFNIGARLNPFKFEVNPGLATSWETSPDGLMITFKITDKAKWHNKPPLNGRPFTAEDIRRVYERNRKVGVTQGSFEAVSSIEAVNPTTLRMKFKQPNPDFLIYAAAREGTIYALEQIDDGSLAKALDVVGTGPFILTSMRRSSHISYVRNPEYWQPGRPYLDGAETKMMPDINARLAGLRAGQFDGAPSPVTNKVEADALKASNPEINITWNTVDRGGLPLGTINLNNPHWKDERVRHAMDLGIDRERQLQILYGGYGIAFMRNFPWTYAFEKRPTSQAEMGPYIRYDPAEARKLLQAAGYENKLTVEFHTQSTSGDSVISWAVDNYKQIGVSVVPKLDQYINVQSQFHQGLFPDTSAGAAVLLTPDNFWQHQLRTNAVLNNSHLSDPQIDVWADQQSSELNPQKRREIIRKIWDLMGAKSYRPMSGAAAGAPSGAWANYVRNYWGGNSINSYVCATGPVQLLKDVWIDKDNPSRNI